MKNFGDRLWEAMKAKRITQTKLVQEVKKRHPSARISQSLVSRWLKNIDLPKPSDDKLEIIAQILNLNHKEFIGILKLSRFNSSRKIKVDPSIRITKKNIEFLLTVFTVLESENKNHGKDVTLGLEDIFRLLSIHPSVVSSKP